MNDETKQRIDLPPNGSERNFLPFKANTYEYEGLPFECEPGIALYREPSMPDYITHSNHDKRNYTDRGDLRDAAPVHQTDPAAL